MSLIKNQVQLIGRLGKDVDLRTTNNGTSVARFSVATNDYYKNSKGEPVEETQWHNITAWGKLAEIVQQQLEKGSEVALLGKLMHRKYEDSEGNTRYTSEIKLSEFYKTTKRTVATVEA